MGDTETNGGWDMGSGNEWGFDDWGLWGLCGVFCQTFQGRGRQT